MRLRRLVTVRHEKRVAKPAITGWTAQGKPWAIPGVGGGIFRVETEEFQVFDEAVNAWVTVDVPTEEVDIGIVDA